MNVPSITAQQFAAQLGSFLHARVMLPLVPLRMQEDDLIYGHDSGVCFDPVLPLLTINGSPVVEERLPVSFREHRETNRGGSDFCMEWFGLDAAVKYAHHQLVKLKEYGLPSKALISRALMFRTRGHELRRLGDHAGAADALLTSAVMMTSLEALDRKSIAHDLFHAARKCTLRGKPTKAALLAEMAAAIDLESDHYSAKAAESWFQSLNEYDDPATARFRISRGILNAHRFFNRAVAANLFERSAMLYLMEGAPASAAFDYLRAANAMAENDGYYEPNWVVVASLLIAAFNIFVRIESDLAVQGMAQLVSSAQLLAAMFEDQGLPLAFSS
jgi:hypothetical protein